MTATVFRRSALAALTVSSTVFGAHGLAGLWPSDRSVPWNVFLVTLSAGWHLAWIAAVLANRTSLLSAPSFLASLEICRRGLAASGFAGAPVMWAAGLELTLLAMASHEAGRKSTLADRLAQWRLGCDQVAAQLQLAQGLVPRVGELLRLTVTRPDASSFRRTHFADLAASLAEMDARLGRHVSAAVMPEQLRQSLLTRGRDLAAQSELAAIEAGLALEHQAMTAAAAFRDECATLSDLAEDDRDAIARGGQAFLLDSVRERCSPRGAVYV